MSNVFMLVKGDGTEEESGEIQEVEGSRWDVFRPREADVLRSVESRTKRAEIVTGRMRCDQKRTG